MEMDRSTDKKYAVVQFVGEFVDGKKQIELVPTLWLTGENPVNCFYPPKNEYEHLDKMVRENQQPQSTWKKFRVELLKLTSTYTKGQKKLQNALRRRPSRVDSTDEEGTVERETSDLHHSKIPRVLNKARNLVQPPSIPENDEEMEESQENVPKNRSTVENTPINDSTVPPPVTSRREKKKIIETRLEELKNQVKNSTASFLVQYNGALIELLTLNLMEKFDGLRRGYQYDINRQMTELKNLLSSTSSANNERGVDPRRKFQWQFPLDGLDAFLEFEKSLDPQDENNAQNADIAIERQEALKDWMEMEVGRVADWQKAIPIILGGLIRKNIQLLYSGVGRMCKGVAKKNFSKTYTFKCLEAYLKVKFNLGGLADKELNIISKVGYFLANAGDRDGGASLRKRNQTL